MEVLSIVLFFLPVFFPIVYGICLAASRKKEGAENSFTSLQVIIPGALEVVFILLMVFFGSEKVHLFNFFGKSDLWMKKDGLAIMFTVLIGFIFFVVSFFAIGYIKHEDSKFDEAEGTKTLAGSFFFGFYFIVWGVLVGLSLAGDLVTFYMFYEIMSITSVILVLHDMSREAIYAAKKYLFYSIAGASLALFGFAFLLFTSGHGSLEFVSGGHYFWESVYSSQTPMDMTLPVSVQIAVFCMVLGFGAKAGLFPLHAWLPSAHPVSPAPASAVLSGIIAKAGVLGIIRVMFNYVGADMLRGTWVQYTLIILSLLTVFMGSMLAFVEKVFKKRLAYSTVSQVSYVLFGLFILQPLAAVGALLHVIGHAVIKCTLFLNAGAVIHATGHHEVKDLKGIGRALPITMTTFTVAALGLVGIPPVCGFFSKYYICVGALSSGTTQVFGYIGTGILLVSAILTAGYLLSISISAFFPGEEFEGYEENLEKSGKVSKGMLLAMIILAAMAVLLGLFGKELVEALTKIVKDFGFFFDMMGLGGLK
ncbi:MAG: proton-conducting membrane transporter [Lachnospiraceae bacterium]|nr:proton-conducting membrane transporter [Lachnospiraceae bacterium]